ncbi:MAG: hypothetical protein ACRDBT_05005, partial [Aeromonas sp.]
MYEPSAFTCKLAAAPAAPACTAPVALKYTVSEVWFSPMVALPPPQLTPVTLPKPSAPQATLS